MSAADSGHALRSLTGRERVEWLRAITTSGGPRNVKRDSMRSNMNATQSAIKLGRAWFGTTDLCSARWFMRRRCSFGMAS
jgi:hypothetical protein